MPSLGPSFVDDVAIDNVTALSSRQSRIIYPEELHVDILRQAKSLESRKLLYST